MILFSEPPLQCSKAPGHFVISHCHVDGFWTAGQNAQIAGAGDGSIEQVALEQHVVLGDNGYDHRS